MASESNANEKTLLDLRDVCVSYGFRQALLGVSLNVAENEIVTLLGANGAGKTTTLNAICGILPLRKGEILFRGQRLSRFSQQKIVDLGIIHVPEGRRIFAPMSVMDNLILGAYRRYVKGEKGAIEKDLNAIFELFPVLGKQRKRLSGTLSGGEQQMLALARGIMSSPTLLLLDEPSLGLAPLIVSELMRAIADLRDRGLAILLVEQNARVALRIAGRGYVMERGTIVIQGTAEGLCSDERVRTAYLGRKHSEVQEGRS